MTARFVALPVGQGDAFYVERPDGSVLVDGGRSVKGLPGLFKATTCRRQVDVLVCTHNDADHVNGVIGYLRDPDLTCGELWLPSEFADRLASLVGRPDAFLAELAENVGKAGTRLSAKWPHASLESLGDQLSQRHGTDERAPGEPLVGLSDSMRDSLQDGQPFAALARRTADRAHLEPSVRRIFVAAASDGGRIRDVMLAAVKVPIRWFDFDPNAPKLKRPHPRIKLCPVNGKEVTPQTRPGISALDYVALSKANRESLVFYLKPDCSSPPVVFCADSRFDGVAHEPWTNGELATAPHHGSEANAAVYEKTGAVGASTITWVRSDQAKTKTRPGCTYRNQLQRYCTRCGTTDAIAVRFDAHMTRSGPVWTPAKEVPTCRC
jgi:metallo-beta-lactamase superfamily protein